MTGVKATLYVFPGSHAAMIGRLLLEHKGIAYKRVDLLPVVAKLATRGLGFPNATVPALKIDGRRIQGTREISRELERIKPEPPLFPADPAAAAVPADPLLGLPQRPLAVAQLRGGREDRRPDRSRDEDRPADHQARLAIQRCQRRERAARPGHPAGAAAEGR